MALKPKHPHICIDEMVWDDPVMIGLSAESFRTYIFSIAWSKSQSGRTEDGLLTSHGLSRIGSTLESTQELLRNGLWEKRGEDYVILKYEEWQMTAEEARVAAEKTAVRSEMGKQAAVKRWNKEPPPEPEAGFDVEKSFEMAWGEWPEPSEVRFTEKREEALESFRTHIVNSKDFATFSAALLKRIKEYHSENKPKAERRKFLGAFKNFCDGRWKDWIPKSYRADGSTPAPLAPEPPPPPVEVGPPVSKFPPRSHGLAADVTDEELLKYLEPKPAA